MNSESLKDKFYSLSKQYNFRYTPVLDQYFLIDFGILQRAVKYANITKEDTILEVGAGMGFITEELAKLAGKVIAVEKDKRLEPVLRESLSSYDNIEFIFEDIMDLKLPQFNKIVSNIPYSLSGPLTFKLLEKKFDTAVVFFQKEFAQKMTGTVNSENYGRLTVMAQYYADVKIEELVSRQSFYPMPKTDAAIVSLKPKNIEYDIKFNNFVREIFRYRNKDVRNGIKTAFEKDIPDDRKIRALTVEQVRELFDKVNV